LLPQSQVEALSTKRHIHLLPDGSFSLGCLNAAKIETLCRAIDYVVREGIREAEEAQAQSIAMELALAAAREAAAKEEAEAAERAAKEAEEAARQEEERARLEDAELMEMSIANAIEAQQRAEEEERMQEQERQEMDEAIRKAAERAEIARRAEEILASIGAGL
jgi:aspartate aminotransferase